jgi:hypothetical protein
MILVRRRYATYMIVSPLFPTLKGRAKVRGRYAAKKNSRNQVSLRRSQELDIFIKEQYHAILR